METTGPTSRIAPLPGTTTGTIRPGWQIGQLLQATVTQSSLGKVLLSIGNRQVSAETSLPLQKGQQLTLQVRSLGEQPVLRITAPAQTSSVTQPTRLLLPLQGSLAPLLAGVGELARATNPPLPPLVAELVRSVFRHMPEAQAVTRPEGLKNAIRDSGIFMENRLAQALPRDSGGLSIGADFKANLLRLIDRLRHWPGSGAAKPPPGNAPAGGAASTPAGAGNSAAATAVPTPDQLRRAVRAAGNASLAAATRLAAAGGTPAATTGESGAARVTPAHLPPPLPGAAPVAQRAVHTSLEAMQQLGNLRTDLLQQAEAALARLQLQQLAAVPRDAERGLLEWLFELPLRRGRDVDLWSFRLAREAPDRQSESELSEPSWSVQLAFDLPGLGPMQARVQLSGERVSTRFWAQQESTLPLLQQHLDELRGLLRTAGLEVGEIDCLPGTMPAAQSASTQSLINEQA